MERISTSVLLLLLGGTLSAQQTITSVANGMVLNPLVWDCVCIPADGDSIIVQHDLVMNTDWGYTAGQIRVDPTGRLVEDVPHGLGLNGSASLVNFGYFKMALLGTGPGTTVVNGGTMRVETAWNIGGAVISNGSIYGLDSLLITGSLQASDTVQAGQVYVGPTGALSGISPVYLFNDQLVQGTMQLFGGELVIADNMLNMGTLELNNVSASVGDDFGNSADMSQSGTLIIGNNFYNADTTGQLSPELSILGLITCMDWYNEGMITGDGRFCVQDTTANSGTVSGTVDICDQTPASTNPPLIDYNIGIVGPNVTFCAMGSCTVGLMDHASVRALSIRYLDPIHLFVTLDRSRFVAITVLDHAGRKIAQRARPVDDGLILDLSDMSAGSYVVVANLRDGQQATGRFVVMR